MCESLNENWYTKCNEKITNWNEQSLLSTGKIIRMHIQIYILKIDFASSECTLFCLVFIMLKWTVIWSQYLFIENDKNKKSNYKLNKWPY